MDKSKSVLIVEDDDAVRGLLVRALGTLYTTHHARTADEAAALLPKIPAPHLILCDIMMPGTSGLEFIKRLKQSPQLKHIPVIFLTAKDRPLDVVEGINAGARAYVTKPFQIADLLDKVAKALR